MTAKSKSSEAAILEQYRVALENVENQPEIANLMVALSYDAATITEGKTLLEQTRTAYDKNKTDDDETTAAYADFDARKEQLANTYAMHRKKAKVLYRKDPVTAEQLGVSGRLPQAYIKWLDTVKKFYATASADAGIQARLASLNLTIADINDTEALIADLETARAEYLREKGESQDATKQKDAAFATMDDWMSEFYAVARIALEDRPQLMEALSKAVKS